MVLSAVRALPGSAFAVVWYAGGSCTSHTTCLMLALMFEVTNSLAICASGLCFWYVFGDCICGVVELYCFVY